MNADKVERDVGVFDWVIHACQEEADWKQVHALLFHMRAEQITDAQTLSPYHIRLWKRAKSELGLQMSPEEGSKRSKARRTRKILGRRAHR